MRAMLLQATGLIKDDSAPLVAAEWPDPRHRRERF